MFVKNNDGDVQDMIRKYLSAIGNKISLKIKDYVRIKRKVWPFAKRYNDNFSTELFKIMSQCEMVASTLKQLPTIHSFIFDYFLSFLSFFAYFSYFSVFRSCFALIKLNLLCHFALNITPLSHYIPVNHLSFPYSSNILSTTCCASL